jgi:hypothetical protein
MSADPVERGPAPLLPLRRRHGPTSPPGPTFRSCSPDRADSCRPLDRLGRYESDCTARGCLAPLLRSANSLSGYEAHTSLGAGAGAGAGDQGRQRARRRPRHLRRHPAKRPQPATGQPLPRARAPTGRSASWPRPSTPSRARAGCRRPPSGRASTATPSELPAASGPAGASAAGGLPAHPLLGHLGLANGQVMPASPVSAAADCATRPTAGCPAASCWSGSRRRCRLGLANRIGSIAPWPPTGRSWTSASCEPPKARPGRSGLHGGKDDHIGPVVAGGGVEVPAAGHQPQRGGQGGVVHLVGREPVLGILLGPLDDEPHR